MRRHRCCIGLVASFALMWAGCGGGQEQAAAGVPSPALGRIAASASQGVGVVATSSVGASTRAVFILEELHNSRAGQIQHAITMVRLHDREKVTDVALEGYLKQRPGIEVGWFSYPGPDSTPFSRARVAVRLLKEGEISAAEFMRLTYDDMRLHAVEDEAEYNVELAPNAIEGAIKLAEEVDARLEKELQEKIEAAGSGGGISAEEHLALAEQLERGRLTKGVQLSAQDLRGWQSWLGFWRGRAGGSKTMVAALETAFQATGASGMVMNIGAAHTGEICRMLHERGFSYAVVTPIVTKNHDERGNLGDSATDRKYRRLSVFTAGVLPETLESAFVPPGKKFEPLISGPEPWFQAKAVLYQSIDRIAAKASGGGKPPFDWNEREFRKGGVFIDPRKVELIAGGAGEPPNIVVFPVLLGPEDAGKRGTVWVKAGVVVAPERSVDDVEAMLQAALIEIQGESEAPTAAVGQVQVSTRTAAVLGRDRSAVLAHKLTTAV